MSRPTGNAGKTCCKEPRLTTSHPKRSRSATPPPWIDSEVKHLLKKKNTARRKATAKSSATAWKKNWRTPAAIKEEFAYITSCFAFELPNKMTWTSCDSTITATNPGSTTTSTRCSNLRVLAPTGSLTCNSRLAVIPLTILLGQ